jgi:hypothetical protein
METEMEKYRLTEPRFKEILRRQLNPALGKGYEPSIKATREEAPAGSSPATVWSDLIGRDIHTLSEPERAVLSVLLYSPQLVDIQEQRMLPIVPAAHPLEGHPLAAGMELKRFRGTLAVTAELHHMPFHPVVQWTTDENERREVPGCWIGDFLAILRDREGVYCANFNVKQTREEFTVPAVGVTVKTKMARATARETARHEVEKQVYADIDIPTIEVAADELPTILVANLRWAQNWQRREHGLSAEQQQIVVDALNDGLDQCASALEVMAAVELSHGIGMPDQKIVLAQAILTRKLRVDLFEGYFFPDKPMLPEQQDVLKVFGHWFRRPA